jgi:hypothetical protein
MVVIEIEAYEYKQAVQLIADAVDGEMTACI